jgi:hypothetical protein
MKTEIERLSMVGCGWYWKKAGAGGVDELGMLEMNGTPSSIPSAYIGTRAPSPLTPGRLAGRMWRRTIDGCRRTSSQLHEVVCVGKNWVTLLTLTILWWESQGCKTTVVPPICTELKRTFKINEAWETAFRVERNAIKLWYHWKIGRGPRFYFCCPVQIAACHLRILYFAWQIQKAANFQLNHTPGSQFFLFRNNFTSSKTCRDSKWIETKNRHV